MGLIQKIAQTIIRVGGIDGLAAERVANVKVRSDGLTALCTDATVVVESTFGFDQQPDTFFRIVETGGAGTTWTIDIAATAADPTSPDRDVPSYQKIFTVVAGEVGDEIKFRDRIIQELNQDTAFKNDVFLKAQNATDRAIVHIYSTKFSASGEFYERPNAGDFQVTIAGAPGDGVVVVGFDNIISRSKPVTITRDFDSPHRLGLFGITGDVNVSSKALSDLFIEGATLDGLGVTSSMTVNGSGTPKEFIIPASITTDVFIQELRFFGQGNGITFGNFLSQNAPLTNGILVSIKSDDVVTTFPLIKTTSDFKNKFAFGQGATGFRLDVASGRDDFIAVFTFENPFIIRVAGTFTTDDFIKAIVQDNLSAKPTELELWAKGFEKEP